MRARSLVIAAAVLGAAGYVIATRWDAVVSTWRAATEPRGDADGAGGARRSGGRRDAAGQSGPLPGTEIRVELAGTPVAVYQPRVAADEADRTYADLVRRLGSGSAIYDPVLSRAAREVAYQSAVIGDSPPEAVLTFLLQSAGAPDSHAAMFRLSTTSEDAEVLGEAIGGALAEAPEGDGALHVGVGEAETPGERFTRRVVVLLARREFELEPTPRAARPGSTWRARGRLPVGFQDPVASVLTPSGELETRNVDVSGSTFTLELPVGKHPGTLWVSIDGVGRHGPTKLVQLAVEVGSELPGAMTARIPDEEPAFADVAAAERRAFELLSADRASLGAPPLEFDAGLSKIARAHSEEMQTRGYFAHLSPSTGLAGDRLTRAGYRSIAHAENLAKNDTLAEAQASLMASVSHRANIARPLFTRVGVGVARGREGDRDAWYVTQLFATPVVPIDGAAAPADIIGQLNAARRKAGRRELGVDDRLADLAQQAAGRAASGDADKLPDQVARSAQRAVDRSVGVSVHVVYGLEQFEPPEVALRREMSAVGVGVAQSADDIHGRTGIVVIVAR